MRAANGTGRNVFRSLLVLHFMGLALSVGVRLACLVIDSQTRTPGLQLLVFGSDLTGVLARTLIAPGFLLMIVTGIAMTLLRYGRRPPIWVWMKVGITAIALLIANPLVAPALRATRAWAHWSLVHHQLAPQFHAAAAQASFYGSIVFALFLLNIPLAVWRPFLAFGPVPRKIARSSPVA